MSNQSKSKPSNLTRARWIGRADRCPDIVTPRRSPVAARFEQGPHKSMATMSVAVSVSPISLSVSSPAFSSPSSSSDEDSDSDSLFDRSSTLPSYGEALASPVSSISTSPADSFHFGKTRAAAPLLSPSYSLEDPFFAAPASIVATNELLAKVFTSSAAVHALPTTSVKVDDLLGDKWEGAVVNDAAVGLRTLYVGGGKLSDLELREAVMDLADRAEEQWGATAVVLALERKSIADLGSLVHGLTYVGFTALSKPSASEDFLLLGLDLA